MSNTIKINQTNPLKIHFIGIGGVSMNGLACIMQNQGHTVSGSDVHANQFTDHLQTIGIDVSIPQDAKNVEGKDLIVYSAAIKDHNVELANARKLNIPTLDRATLLGQITNQFTDVIGVAGCHGKTTITSMLALILMKQSCSPTIHIGGKAPFLDNGTYIGEKDLFVTEACEYVNSFHKFHVTTTVVNNIDDDHLDFFEDIDAIYESFQKYILQLPDTGLFIANIDDPLVKKLTTVAKCKIETFSLKSEADWQCKNITSDKNANVIFDIYHNGEFVVNCPLSIPGNHNASNALVAIILAASVGVSPKESVEILADYQLTKRRFEYYGDMDGIKVYHDYGHHPSEIKATLQAASTIEHNKLFVVFQCNSYSRALTLRDKYAQSLKDVPVVLVPDIYPGREVDTGLIHAKNLVNAINRVGGNAKYVPTFEEIKDYLKQNAKPGDLILTFGSGDVGTKTRLFTDK